MRTVRWIPRIVERVGLVLTGEGAGASPTERARVESADAPRPPVDVSALLAVFDALAGVEL